MDDLRSPGGVDGALLYAGREDIDFHDLQSVIEAAGFVVTQRGGICGRWGLGSIWSVLRWRDERGKY
jgi:hypothetical protein